MAKKKKTGKTSKKAKGSKTRVRLQAVPPPRKRAKPKSKAKQGLASTLEDDFERIEAEIAKFRKSVDLPGAVAPVTIPSYKPAKAAPLPATPVVSAKEVEREVEKEVGFSERAFYSAGDLTPLAFYFVSALVCTAVLAFLFGSLETFAIYFLFSLFLWWWSHRLHVEESRLLRPFLYLGLVVVMLFLFYWMLDDLLSLVVCIVYALSFIIAAVLYLYHMKRELSGEIHRSFSRTFLVMFYLHIMALTAASLVAYVIPMFLLNDSFVSITFLLLSWLFPAILVYFFMTKFLYLRFFDRVHIRRDLLKGLAHGVVYSAIFVLLVSLVYTLTAIQFAGEERDDYEAIFTQVFTKLSNVDFDFSVAASDKTPDLLGFKVTQDVISISDKALKDATEIKKTLNEPFSLEDYFTDRYFTILTKNRIEVSGIASYAYGINEVKSDLIREFDRMRDQEKAGLFDDGTADLAEHRSSLRVYLSNVYVPYAESFRIARLRQKITSSGGSYSGLLGDGELVDFNLVYRPEMEGVLPGDSRFSRLLYDVVYHTSLFRDFMVLVFSSIALQVEETIEPTAFRQLGDTGQTLESMRSTVLRYRAIKANHEAGVALSE